MAVIRKTTYRCDACGEAVDKKSELVSIRIERGTHGYQRWNDHTIGVKADFCDECESRFLSVIGEFYGGIDKVLSIRRKPKPVPKAKKPSGTRLSKL